MRAWGVDVAKNKARPGNWETERSLIGGLLLDPTQFHEIREHLNPADFADARHEKLFGRMSEMSAANQPPDPTMVLDELERRGELDDCGGAAYVLGLPQACPSVENLKIYAQRIKDHAVRRNLHDAALKIIEDVQSGEKETSQLLDGAEQAVFQLSQLGGPRDWHALSEVIDQQMMEIQNRAAHPGEVTGIPTGFADLDRKLSGLQKTDLIILAARPAMGKCLDAASEIVLADGSVRTIEAIVRTGEARLQSLGTDWRFHEAAASAFVDDGVKPAFRVATRSGRTVSTTLSHPFLTAEGWKPLAEIEVGTAVAVPRRLAVFGTEEMRACEVALLAYLIGDGCLVDGSPEFTNTNERILGDFVEAVEAFGGVETRIERVGGRAPTVVVRGDASLIAARRTAFGERVAARVAEVGRTRRDVAAAVGVSAGSVTNWAAGATVPDDATFATLCADLGVDPDALAPGGVAAARANGPNALTRWLDGHGLWGKGARDKFVPDAVFRLRKPLLARFLNRLFATDGWATVLASGQPQVGFASTSERLLRQVAHLLLRFGVVGSIKRKALPDGHAAWQIDVTDAVSLRAFVDEIGIFGKEEAVRDVARALDVREPHAGRDVFPAALWDRIARAKGAESWASLARRADVAGWANLHVGKRGLGRDRLARLALAVGDAELCAMAAGDVIFDEVVSIEPLGARQVYDLTVPGTHNFVANDVCVHNTAFVLNLALNAAERGGVAVGVFSLEMSRHQLATRLLVSKSRVDATRVRTGQLDPHDDWRRLVQAAEELHALPILIDDQPGLTITQLRSKARRLRAEHPNLGLLIIDYLQLMQGTGGAKESREQAIANISRGMKILAKELEIPVIALSQLNRSLESRTDKRPMPSDLRESGSIEQDADIIMFIYRDEVYNQDSPDKGVAEIIIAKQRAGPIGTVKLAFIGQHVLFQNLAGPGDVPDGYV